MTKIAQIGTAIAFARRGATRAPGVFADAFLSILHEFAFIAVARRPGLDTVAVLAAGVEVSTIFGRALCFPVALGQRVLASALVDPGELGIEQALDFVQKRKPSADPLPHQRDDLRIWWRERSGLHPRR